MPASNPDLPDRVRHFVENGYIPTIESIAKKMTAALWWTERDSSGKLQRQGGTICFIDTGQRLIGVTAGHIHMAYLKRLEASSEISCQIGASTFDPTQRLIQCSSDPDLATYDVPEFYAVAAGSYVHHAPEWPPKIDQIDGYIVGGWPWSLSREDAAFTDGVYAGVEKVTQSFLCILARLSSQSERNLSILTYTSTSKPWGQVSLPPGTNLGGMSGGPVYRLSESGLSLLTLVGTIYEYNPNFELVLAHPLSLVDPNGHIRI